MRSSRYSSSSSRTRLTLRTAHGSGCSHVMKLLAEAKSGKSSTTEISDLESPEGWAGSSTGVRCGRCDGAANDDVCHRRPLLRSTDLCSTVPWRVRRRAEQNSSKRPIRAFAIMLLLLRLLRDLSHETRKLASRRLCASPVARRTTERIRPRRWVPLGRAPAGWTPCPRQ